MPHLPTQVCDEIMTSWPGEMVCITAPLKVWPLEAKDLHNFLTSKDSVILRSSKKSFV